MNITLPSLFVSPLLLLAAACSTEQASSPSSAMTETTVSGQIVARGSFSGRNDHVVSGGVELVEQDGAMYLRLKSDFSLDGAPDPRIGFGRSGEYDAATTFTDLESKTGEQTYALPAGFDLGSLNEATIWCEDFSVALGVAPLR